MGESSVPDYIAIGFEKIDRDLRYLLECLGEVLMELGLGELAEHLTWFGAENRPDIGVAPPAQLGLVYSIAFQLLNMLEENTAAAMRSLREVSEGLSAERGLWGDQLRRLQGEGFTGEEIAAALRFVRVEPVLTAHPTEAKRLAVLEQHRALFTLINTRENGPSTPSSRDLLRDQTKAALERLWRTGEILLEKPSLADERRNVLHYLRDVFPAALPELDARLRSAWREAGFDPAILVEATLPEVRFGTWVGGDRDGHPGVTTAVTAETLERSCTSGPISKGQCCDKCPGLWQ